MAFLEIVEVLQNKAEKSFVKKHFKTVFRTLSKFYDAAFFEKKLMAFVSL